MILPDGVDLQSYFIEVSCKVEAMFSIEENRVEFSFTTGDRKWGNIFLYRIPLNDGGDKFDENFHLDVTGGMGNTGGIKVNYNDRVTDMSYECVDGNYHLYRAQTLTGKAISVGYDQSTGWALIQVTEIE